MSNQQKEISCVACKAYLFEDDDVVHCPVCGAPHHRDCYKSIGHCALEELHGTPDEYDADKLEATKQEETKDNFTEDNTTTCRVCGEKYDNDSGKCPHCSAPNFSSSNIFAQFDFLGGVPADYKLDEDVTAEEAKQFVGSNTHKYIPKFALLGKNKKVSWNWIAFLLPSSWMLSRKMYKSGIITGILTIIASLLSLPLTMAFNGMEMPETGSYMEMIMWMASKMPEIDPAIIIVAFLGSTLSIAIQILSGLFSNYMYKNHVIKSIKEIKNDSEDIEYDLRKKGGSNIILFFLSALALQYIPMIIVSIL